MRPSRFFLAFVALAAAACAHDGDPRPPLAPTPTPVATASATASASASPTATPTATVTATASFAGTPVYVRPGEVVGTTNAQLLGVGWNTGRLDLLAPLVPPVVRIDSHLDAVSPAPGEWRLDGLLAAVAAVHAAGGEPLVILYPMPAWLGQPNVAGCVPPVSVAQCSPRNVAPSDFDAWEQVIAHVVRALATAPRPALRFEVWNEPDGPAFWHDTPDAFRRTAVASHRAVARVAAETGLPLEVGGPASTLINFASLRKPSTTFLAAYVEAVVAAGQPLHFVSWHWYANTPNLGPDGNEGFVDDATYQLLAGINLRMTPRIYGDIVASVRAAIAPFVTASARAPALVADEWNISGGGYDRRNDSHVGAAFAAATLIEMERAGLDRANIYRAVSDAGRIGDWGIVGANGERKPNWWVFRAWQQMSGRRLAVQGDDPAGGLWVRAVAADDTLHIVLAAFRAAGDSGRAVELVLDGDCAARRAEVATLDSASDNFGTFEEITVSGGRLPLQLGDQSVTWARLRCE